MKTSKMNYAQFEEFVVDYVNTDYVLLELIANETKDDPQKMSLSDAWSEWTEQAPFSPKELYFRTIEYLTQTKKDYDPNEDFGFIKLIDDNIAVLHSLIDELNILPEEIEYIALKRIKQALKSIDFDYSQSFNDFIDLFYCSWKGIDEFFELLDTDQIFNISGFIEGYLKAIWEVKHKTIR